MPLCKATKKDGIHVDDLPNALYWYRRIKFNEPRVVHCTFCKHYHLVKKAKR